MATQTCRKTQLSAKNRRKFHQKNSRITKPAREAGGLSHRNIHFQRSRGFASDVSLTRPGMGAALVAGPRQGDISSFVGLVVFRDAHYSIR